jgi:hypothetical protein
MDGYPLTVDVTCDGINQVVEYQNIEWTYQLLSEGWSGRKVVGYIQGGIHINKGIVS